MLSDFPRDVLDEILILIETVPEGFPSYSCLSPLVPHVSYMIYSMFLVL